MTGERIGSLATGRLIGLTAALLLAVLTGCASGRQCHPRLAPPAPALPPTYAVDPEPVPRTPPTPAPTAMDPGTPSLGEGYGILDPIQPVPPTEDDFRAVREPDPWCEDDL